ncbi:hypothetical protein IC575_020280 [Cucumis melo]
MHAGDILLGRPWQYDREVTYDGLLNKYTFTLDGDKFTLLPLSPYEVHCDHLKLEKKRKEFEEKERREESKLKERANSEEREEGEGQKVSANQERKKVILRKKKIKNVSLVMRKGEVRDLFSFEAPNFVLMCKGRCLENEPNSNDGLPSAFKSLLQEFNDMFPHEDAPMGLPPLRGIEHQIDFIPGATLPNMVAYRTNPTETKEIQRQVEELIQRQVEELMDKGYIRESMSPYSVPMILVPKKDGTWRMCVDYRAINKITVKYRHPIPRLDDMLDELHGANLLQK